jgi:hypothetical protein
LYRRRKHIVNFLHAWSAGSLLFFAGIILYTSAGRDDVFKSLWPAWTFSEFGQIVNYNGEALEQSSSLLQVLILGSMHRMAGGDIVLLGALLAVLCGMAAVMFSQLLAQDLGLSLRQIRFTPWLVAGSSFFTYWSWGGLDASLAALCMVLWAVALVRYLKMKRLPGLLLTTMAFLLVRPENLFVGALALGLLGVYSWKTECQDWPWKRVRNAFLVILVMGGLLMLVRWQVWGTALPHTVLAKGGGWNFGKVYRGMNYWAWEMIRHPEFLLLNLACGAGLLLASRRKSLNNLLLVVSLAFASGVFVVVSGGDWMENGRFFVPMIPLMVILVLGTWDRKTMGVKSRWWNAIPLILLVASGLGLVHTARSFSTGQPLGPETGRVAGGAGFNFIETSNRVHARDLILTRTLIDLVDDLWQEKQAPVTIMSQQAGLVMFHTTKRHYGRVRFIDLVGLCTRDFTHCPVTKDRGGTYGGLNMDYYYLFSDYERLHAECGFEWPDIIYDIDGESKKKQVFLAQNGYKVVFEDSGEVKGWSESLPGMYIGNGQFIAVRQR